MSADARTIMLWFPDWPITAHLRTQARDVPRAEHTRTDEPLAVLDAGAVIACSAAARAAGVSRGQRRRDAQAACARLRVIPFDAGRDERAFHSVLTHLEQLVPGVQPLRPGLAAIRARGPARFYRGEQAAAEALRAALIGIGLDEVRVGIADGLFTAEQAARTAETIAIVPPDRSAEFLAPLPVSALGDAELALLLTRLGLRSLGDFAAFDAERVRERFGPRGMRLRSLAAGADSRGAAHRVPPPELTRELALEPPLELAEQVAFAVRQTAGSFCDGIGEQRLVCTAVRITVETDRGERSERVWQHPTSFDASAVVDRVRWQLQPAAGETPLTGGVSRILLEPESVDDGDAHQPALIGQGPDERSHHAMTRVQAVLGHRAVLTPSLGGGRWLAEREGRAPWGDVVAPESPKDRPWPGMLPAPLPAEVFREPRPARVLGRGDEPISVDERGFVTAPPAALDGRAITAWAGPWPIIERSWDPLRARRAHRFQLVDAHGSAWLAVFENDAWWLEGRYS